MIKNSNRIKWATLLSALLTWTKPLCFMGIVHVMWTVGLLGQNQNFNQWDGMEIALGLLFMGFYGIQKWRPSWMNGIGATTRMRIQTMWMFLEVVAMTLLMGLIAFKGPLEKAGFDMKSWEHMMSTPTMKGFVFMILGWSVWSAFMKVEEKWSRQDNKIKEWAQGGWEEEALEEKKMLQEVLKKPEPSKKTLRAKRL